MREDRLDGNTSVMATLAEHLYAPGMIVPHCSELLRSSPCWRREASKTDQRAGGELTGTAVYTINADGATERRLTDPDMVAGYPDWSPDGE
jgi:hypothetical protein